MTGRFRKLEFAQPRADLAPDLLDATQPLAGTPVRNADHFERAALEAFQAGEFEQALRLYTRCLREDRARIAAWAGQVRMLVELGEHAEARMWADKALETFRGNGELLAAKAQACLREGDTRTAVGASDLAIRSPGASPWRWIARGEVMLVKNRALAPDCFDRALAEPSAGWFERVAIARSHLFHARAAAGLRYLDQALAMQPSQPFIWLTLARCQEALGWHDRALESYARCLQLAPNHAAAKAEVETLTRRGGVSKLVRALGGRFTRVIRR